MANFPTLSVAENADFNTEIVKPIVKTKFEGNYNQTRPKYTRSMQNFNLRFNPITETDKTTLETFFNTYSGSSFNWTNPKTSTVYIVRFVEQKLTFKYLGAGFYDVMIKLEEV